MLVRKNSNASDAVKLASNMHRSFIHIDRECIRFSGMEYFHAKMAVRKLNSSIGRLDTRRLHACQPFRLANAYFTSPRCSSSASRLRSLIALCVAKSAKGLVCFRRDLRLMLRGSRRSRSVKRIVIVVVDPDGCSFMKPGIRALQQL